MSFIEHELGVNASVGLPLGEAGLEPVRYHFSSKNGTNLTPLNWRILAEVTMGAMLNIHRKVAGSPRVVIDDPEEVAKYDKEFLGCLQSYEDKLNKLFNDYNWGGRTPNIPIEAFTLKSNSKGGKVVKPFWMRTVQKGIEYRLKVEAYKELGR